MVEATKNAVIVKREKAPYGTKVYYRFKCDDCGYVRQGALSDTTINGKGIKELGTVVCDKCKRRQNPTFESR